MIDSSRPHGAPLPLLICTCIFLAVSISTIAAEIAMFSAAWDPCSLMGGLFLLPVTLYLTIQQYRAVFHADQSAASIMANILLTLAALAAFTIGATLKELTFGRIQWSLSLFDVSVPWALFTSITGYLDFLWSQKLKQVQASLPRKKIPLRFSARDKLVAGIAILSIALLTPCFMISTKPQYAENVTPDKSPIRLPPTATHVSFCQGQRGTIACEFTIDEPTFITWVNSGIGSPESQAAHIPLKPITTPFAISRYPSLSLALKGDELFTVREGLYYSWSKEDRTVHAVFDRPTNRVFYFAQFH